MPTKKKQIAQLQKEHRAGLKKSQKFLYDSYSFIFHMEVIQKSLRA